MIFLFFPWFSVLIVEAGKDKKVLACFRLKKGEEFSIYYTHSVNRRPVFDTLVFDLEKLHIVRSKFDSFGAGMPQGDEDGARLKRESRWLIYELDRVVPDVGLFVGFQGDNGIIIKGKKIPFLNLARAGTLLNIKPTRFSFYSLQNKRCEG